MPYRVLINDAVKEFLIRSGVESRGRLRRVFEYLENGLWDGGLRIKKLRGVSRKTILEGRLNRGDRVLFTLGKEKNEQDAGLLIYVWDVVPHDQVERKARNIVPENAPFLSFNDYESSETRDIDLSELDDSCVTQETLEEQAAAETGAHRWFLLDDTEWQRLLLYSKDDFEIFLYLTAEQRALLNCKPPLLLSGTAGSGKTTLSIYYLFLPFLARSDKLFLTYNRHLRNFCERLYRSLLNEHPERTTIRPPEFLTFKELCYRIVPGAERHFVSNREIDSLSFPRLFHKHRLAEKYDSALIWEEIRSIIKGAKPQINAKRLRAILSAWDRLREDPEMVWELREELLAVRNLSVREKAEAVLGRLLGLSLTDCAMQLDSLLTRQSDLLLRAMQTVAAQMEKHESDFSSPLMTLAEYEQLGHKRAPLFQKDRSEIYAAAQWYQSQLQAENLWDEIDLTRSAIRAMEAGPAHQRRYDFVCCDEIQDFTDIQISLLVRLPRNPKSLLLAGDPKQVVNPSGFRWEEARRLFYERSLPVPEIHHLTVNFRCVGSIVALSNALLRLKQELLGTKSDEKFDEWKFQGRPPFLIEGVTPAALLESLRIPGAGRTILTRDEAERDRLKEALQTELVFTIREAKGLEFKSVVLWKFCGDSQTSSLWSRILNLETAKIHDAWIRHEINLLYVGITRAQQNLILYDGPDGSPIWSSARIGDLLFRAHSAEFLQEAWRSVSTPDEWKEQGDYFFEQEHFRAAAECYRNANLPERMHLASAYAAERRGEFSAAAFHWLELKERERAAEALERAGEPARALSLWEELGNAQRAFDCRIRVLELEKRFAEVAELWERQKRFDKAKESWQKAGRHDRLAVLYEGEKRYYEAASAHEMSGHPEKAAPLYGKVRQLEKSASCYESARMYREAAEVWKKAKKREKWLECVKRLNDPILLAEYFEAQQEWKNALEHYRKAMSPALYDRFVAELQKMPRKHASRALRLTLLGRAGEAAESWERARIFDQAALLYKSAGDPDSAARCFAKNRQWGEALRLYAQGEQDPKKGSPGLRRALWQCVHASAKGRAEAEAIADSLRAEGRFSSAYVIFSELGRLTKAAECAASLGQIPLAFSCWLQNRDYSRLVKYAVEKKLFGEAVLALRNLLMVRFDTDVSQNLQMLVNTWLSVDRSAETMKVVTETVRMAPTSFPFSFMLETLESAGLHDETLHQVDLVFPHLKRHEIRTLLQPLKNQAEARERAGDAAAAGLRYLILNQTPKAKRCWAQVQAHSGNLYCLQRAGQWDRSVQWLAENEKYFQAALVAHKYGDIVLASDLFVKAGLPESGARILERDRQYDAARILYLKAGRQGKAATMLERLRRFEEAARIWQQLGNHQKYLRCMKKLQPHATQLKLTDEQ